MFDELPLRLLISFQLFRARARDDDGRTISDLVVIMSMVGVVIVVAALVAFRGGFVDALHPTTD